MTDSGACAEFCILTPPGTGQDGLRLVCLPWVCEATGCLLTSFSTPALTLLILTTTEQVGRTSTGHCPI